MIGPQSQCGGSVWTSCLFPAVAIVNRESPTGNGQSCYPFSPCSRFCQPARDPPPLTPYPITRLPRWATCRQPPWRFPRTPRTSTSPVPRPSRWRSSAPVSARLPRGWHCPGSPRGWRCRPMARGCLLPVRDPPAGYVSWIPLLASWRRPWLPVTPPSARS